MGKSKSSIRSREVVVPYKKMKTEETVEQMRDRHITEQRSNTLQLFKTLIKPYVEQLTEFEADFGILADRLNRLDEESEVLKAQIGFEHDDYHRFLRNQLHNHIIDFAEISEWFADVSERMRLSKNLLKMEVPGPKEGHDDFKRSSEIA